MQFKVLNGIEDKKYAVDSAINLPQRFYGLKSSDGPPASVGVKRFASSDFWPLMNDSFQLIAEKVLKFYTI